MDRLRILLVENTPSMAAVLTQRLELDKRFDVSERSDAVTAVQLVQAKEFDVVFIDLHLNDRDSGEPIFDGIAVGEAVRTRLPHAVIVMYSQVIKADKEVKFPHFDECLRAGADKIMARAVLLSYRQKTLSALIDELVAAKREAEKADSHLKFDGRLPTLAAIDIFGATRLRRLIAKCVPDRAYLEAEAIQSGYSGAAVFQVRASHDEQFTDPLRLIIKVSRSQFALEDELQRRPAAGSLYASASALPAIYTVAGVDDLYAVPYAEVRGRMLLRDYLLDGKLTRTAERVLSRLVTALLVNPAKESRPASDFDLSKDAYRLRPKAVAQIDAFLTDSSKWTATLSREDLRAIAFTQGLIEKVLSGHWNFTLNGQHVARLHGDFHCRNVFVSSYDAPFLVDFGRSDVYPRLFDFAALDADIVLSLLDHKAGRDQDFSKLTHLFKLVTREYPFTEGDKTLDRNDRIRYLRSSLLKAVKNINNVSRLEYGETLIFQYLRYLRFPNLPNPKKILAARLIENLSSVLHIR